MNVAHNGSKRHSRAARLNERAAESQVRNASRTRILNGSPSPTGTTLTVRATRSWPPETRGLEVRFIFGAETTPGSLLSDQYLHIADTIPAPVVAPKADPTTRGLALLNSTRGPVERGQFGGSEDIAVQLLRFPSGEPRRRYRGRSRGGGAGRSIGPLDPTRSENPHPLSAGGFSLRDRPARTFVAEVGDVCTSMGERRTSRRDGGRLQGIVLPGCRVQLKCVTRMTIQK